MTTTHDCDSVLAGLDAWLDGSMPQADRVRVELHLASCEDCRTIADDARVIAPMARDLPRAIDPPRDLWPDIRARLEASPSVTSERGGGWSTGAWAAAALVLVALASGMATAIALRQGPVVPAPTLTPTAAQAGVAFHSDVEQAATELAAAVEVRRDELDPETLEIVERNLKIIDQAITETRAALEHDPADGRAKDALVSAYNQKVRLLQAVLHTPSRG